MRLAAKVPGGIAGKYRFKKIAKYQRNRHPSAPPTATAMKDLHIETKQAPGANSETSNTKAHPTAAAPRPKGLPPHPHPQLPKENRRLRTPRQWPWAANPGALPLIPWSNAAAAAPRN